MDVCKKLENHSYALGQIMGWGWKKLMGFGRAKRRKAFHIVRKAGRHHARQMMKHELQEEIDEGQSRRAGSEE